MSIYTTSPQNVLGYLNAPGLPSTILTGAGTQTVQLTVGEVYRVQAQGASAYLGFGVDAATSATNADPAAGEFIDSGEVKVFAVTSASVASLSRTGADVRVWKVAGI